MWCAIIIGFPFSGFLQNHVDLLFHPQWELYGIMDNYGHFKRE